MRRAIDLACIMLGVPTFSNVVALCRSKWGRRILIILLLLVALIVSFILSTLFNAAFLFKEVL